jgi:tRNA pseudouridine32 synthase/23S rRNA pseudouridine746 synthase
VSIPIFLETEWLLVVDKPHGWLTTPARLADDPRPCLGRNLQTQVGSQIFPVHRLDFEVSGLTLWAKDANSHRRAQEWFERSQVRKLYEAFSRQGPAHVSEWMEWKSKLARGKKRAFIAPHGKPSITRARTIARESGLVKWELVAVTGRPHQLRFEMFHRGFPIMGDTLYGGEDVGRPEWLALRAIELDLSGLPETDRLGLPPVLRTTPLNP